MQASYRRNWVSESASPKQIRIAWQSEAYPLPYPENFRQCPSIVSMIEMAYGGCESFGYAGTRRCVN
jgi:hypothetical protein